MCKRASLKVHLYYALVFDKLKYWILRTVVKRTVEGAGSSYGGANQPEAETQLWENIF